MLQLFKDFELNILIVSTLPPGYSPFNPVERKMAPLSLQFLNIILDHEHFGSHLNSQRQTVDDELERRNFKHAGEVASKQFEKMVYSGFKTSCSYVDPPESMDDFEIPDEYAYDEISERWKSDHVRTGKYAYVVVSCDDPQCCPRRDPYIQKITRSLMPNGFLPPPVKLSRKNGQIKVNKEAILDKNVKFTPLSARALFAVNTDFPYDYFCPSRQKSIETTICPHCKICFPNKTQKLKHKRNAHPRQRGREQSIDFSLEEHNSKQINDVKQILNYRPGSKEYYCELKDGECEWLTIINDHNKHVQDFLNRTKTNISIFNVDDPSWMFSHNE